MTTMTVAMAIDSGSRAAAARLGELPVGAGRHIVLRDGRRDAGPRRRGLDRSARWPSAGRVGLAAAVPWDVVASGSAGGVVGSVAGRSGHVGSMPGLQSASAMAAVHRCLISGGGRPASLAGGGPW